MLTPGRRTLLSGHRGRALLSALIAMAALVLAPAASATAGPAMPHTADDPAVGAGTEQESLPSGLTVSWLPTSNPVIAKIGEMSTGTFWVSNGTTKAISVVITPVTAVPGNNGSLTVQPGADARFPDISYSPSEFVAEPGSTTAITVTTTVPGTLGPGAYILPAAVTPASEATGGSISIRQSIVALVTLQIPGEIDAQLEPRFIGAQTTEGAVIRQFPGLPAIQISSTGHDVLRVYNNSSTSLYSYNEITATQVPLGTVEFDGHTKNVLANYRTSPELYFPGLYRDYPVTWSANPLGFGTAELTAYVAYNPEPSKLKQVSMSSTVIVISPWWLLAIVLYLGTLLVVADRRTRRHSRRQRHIRRQLSSTVWQIVGSVVLALFVAALVVFSELAVFLIASAVGIIAAGAVWSVSRRRSAVAAARLLLSYQGGIGAVLAGAIVTLILATVASWSPGIAIALVAGAGVWTLLAWWIHTWNANRLSV